MTLLIILIAASIGFAEVTTETVNYAGFEGYLAYDREISEPQPAVVIIHQWMGLTDYEKGRARQLAELGYVVFAADMYGKGIRPKDRAEASQQAGKFYGDRSLFRSRANRAIEQVRSYKQVDPDRIVVMGYCFGGTAALEVGRSGANVQGIVTFHGGLSNPTPDDAKRIGCPVLVLHGADDPHVSPDEVRAFQVEMDAADADYVFVSFANAVHGFTQKGSAYNENADRRSWEYMLSFLKEVTAPAR